MLIGCIIFFFSKTKVCSCLIHVGFNLYTVEILHQGDLHLCKCVFVFRNLTRKALILQNIPCSDAACDGLGRSFSVRWDLSLHPSADLAVYPAFFDYRENVRLLVNTVSVLQYLFAFTILFKIPVENTELM